MGDEGYSKRVAVTKLLLNANHTSITEEEYEALEAGIPGWTVAELKRERAKVLRNIEERTKPQRVQKLSTTTNQKAA